jgi:hypothetical protein
MKSFSIVTHKDVSKYGNDLIPIVVKGVGYFLVSREMFSDKTNSFENIGKDLDNAIKKGEISLKNNA